MAIAVDNLADDDDEEEEIKKDTEVRLNKLSTEINVIITLLFLKLNNDLRIMITPKPAILNLMKKQIEGRLTMKMPNMMKDIQMKKGKLPKF